MMKTCVRFAAAVLLCGSSVIASAQEQSYLHDRITIDGLYKRNLGNFSSVWSSAVGGYVSYGIAFPEHNLLVVRTGLVKNNLREGVDYPDASSLFIPLHVGGRYYFITTRLMPFVSFMNGINVLFENTDLEGDQKSRTLVKYAWEVGLGLTVNLDQTFALDVHAAYQSYFYETDAMMTGFEYTLGLAWNFPD